MNRLVIPAALMWAFLLTPAAFAEPGRLSVTVGGIAAPRGAIMIGVYDQTGYETDKAVATAMVPVAGETVTSDFEGLAAGEYGIKLFHDVDGNGKMDTNPFGMPIEPYAFSNNAEGRFGPATWDAAAFDLGPGGGGHTINLKGE
ncbi:MAG: DUF2141 domain-containing protein [Alphaproteobacteria bacterium]|nr:DUF2141 domain-containing protein [Alphaproteobacteria bacterium]